MKVGKVAGIRQPPAKKGENYQKREKPVFEDALGHSSYFRKVRDHFAGLPAD
jgi:hypothetical protein